jgi:hypothetical protein
MVLDEIDAASAKMGPGGKKKAKPNVQTTTASAVAPKDNPILEQSKQWWERATSLAPMDIDSTIVNCQLGGAAQFMSKDDCLSRGGTPKGISG